MGDIETLYAQRYSEGLRILQSQKKSKLEMAVTHETDIMERKSFDQLDDQDELDERTSRNGDTPISEADHRRRWIHVNDFEKAYLLDREDEIRGLNNPINAYTRMFTTQANRKKDDLIIKAFDATAVTGKTGTGTAAFNTAFSIAHGTSNMTVEKIRDAHQMLVEAENDIDDPENALFLAMAEDQITALMLDPEITSIDYNNQKVLVNGKLDTWFGFKIIQSERLPLISTVRTCFAWCKSSMKLGYGAGEMTKVSERNDKGHSMQAYAKRQYGATRLDEKGVVRIYAQQ